MGLQENIVIIIKIIFICNIYVSTDAAADKQFELVKNTQISKANTPDDKWVWGYVDNVTDVTQKTTENQGSIPDFSSSGRRISDAKCMEYIWQVKCGSGSNKPCTDHIIKNGGPSGPYFALGDRDPLPGEFPHTATVGWKRVNGSWSFLCGAILISPNFVLTAAHCTNGTRNLQSQSSIADPIPKIVRLGYSNFTKDVKILRSIVHPLYDPPKKYYDIGLMELQESVTFTKYIHPACLWSNADTKVLGTQATLSGRAIITKNKLRPLGFQAVTVDLVDTPTCDEMLKRYCNRLWCGVQDHQICAGKLIGGVGSCQGDSGGPLQVAFTLPPNTEGFMHYVVGVISFGAGCARSFTPTILSRVASFTDWIEDNVWK